MAILVVNKVTMLLMMVKEMLLLIRDMVILVILVLMRVIMLVLMARQTCFVGICLWARHHLSNTHRSTQTLQSTAAKLSEVLHC